MGFSIFDFLYFVNTLHWKLNWIFVPFSDRENDYNILLEIISGAFKTFGQSNESCRHSVFVAPLINKKNVKRI